MVKRLNRTILSTIVTSVKSKDQKDWDKRIKEVERNLNNTINKTIGKTPFEILHGYMLRFQDGVLRLLADEEAEIWKELGKLRKEAREKIVREQEKMKTYYNKKKLGSLSFEQGEIVVVKRNSKSTEEPTKTQPKFRGPMVVTEVLLDNTYRISQLEEAYIVTFIHQLLM
ncbi:uncharacterized protein LOC118179837 [Stegodyphus dumicola]|uniref:uncharacterized protein LOC118179837 n=1 Tax=Stegodyphus dumicola TaxID=202533 RepID=UPI0015AA61FF|nr:uncharacterized protein LOC118179837 [Stegodyphus dumicola]